MYACVYVYVYIYIYIHIHICISTEDHEYIYIYIYICISRQEHVYCYFSQRLQLMHAMSTHHHTQFIHKAHTNPIQTTIYADRLRVKCVGVLAAARARNVPPVGVRAVAVLARPIGDLSVPDDCVPSLQEDRLVLMCVGICEGVCLLLCVCFVLRNFFGCLLYWSELVWVTFLLVYTTCDVGKDVMW